MIGVEIGKVYDYFDDGKIRPTRKYKVRIKEIVPFNNIDKEILEQWQSESKECDWIYKNTTDYFIIGELDLEPEIEKVIFVRTKENDWFSLGYWAGYLDHDDRLLKQMKEYYDS